MYSSHAPTRAARGKQLPVHPTLLKTHVSRDSGPPLPPSSSSFLRVPLRTRGNSTRRSPRSRVAVQASVYGTTNVRLQIKPREIRGSRTAHLDLCQLESFLFSVREFTTTTVNGSIVLSIRWVTLLFCTTWELLSHQLSKTIGQGRRRTIEWNFRCRIIRSKGDLN